MKLSKSINQYRLIAILEGVSYLLLGITMPLKYALDIPEPNYVVGMVHGVLFILYIMLTVQGYFKYNWRFKTGFFMLIASLIPAGTFYADRKILKPMSISQQQ